MDQIKAININVSDLRATAPPNSHIVCGNKYKLLFTFDSEWEGLEVKTARLNYARNGVKEHRDVVFSGTEAEIEPLSDISEVEIGVFAGNLKTTMGVIIPCERSIRCSSGVPADPTPDVYDQIMERINNLINGGGGSGYAVRLAEVVLTSDGWKGDASPYSQIVDIEGVTPFSQVDLTPSIEQLAIFYQKDLAFVTENEDGVVTVYALGDKPQNDYTIQVTITEVSV